MPFGFSSGVQRRTLLFLFQTGCDACAEAHPFLEGFKKAHPEIVVQEVDLAVADWPEDEITSPEYLPSYADLAPGARPRTVVGRILTAEELESWFFVR